MSPSKHVYLLQHVRSDDEDSCKTIGIYSSDEEARAAIVRLRDKPGFRDYPEGFSIGPYPLNKDHWVDGFGNAWD
jgi:homoserine kinase type II